jgi:hypothetical protein
LLIAGTAIPCLLLALRYLAYCWHCNTLSSFATASSLSSPSSKFTTMKSESKLLRSHVEEASCFVGMNGFELCPLQAFWCVLCCSILF